MNVEDPSLVEAEKAHAHEHGEEPGAHHGHGHDPNEGVVKGEPPTPAWVWTAAAIGLITALGTVLLALAIG